MTVQRNRGEGRQDVSDDTPAASRSVGRDSGAWRRDKARFLDWMMTGIVLLLVALITGAFVTYSDITTRMVRVETKIDDLSRLVDQLRERPRDSTTVGGLAGTGNPSRNSP